MQLPKASVVPIVYERTFAGPAVPLMMGERRRITTRTRLEFTSHPWLIQAAFPFHLTKNHFSPAWTTQGSVSFEDPLDLAKHSLRSLPWLAHIR